MDATITPSQLSPLEKNQSVPFLKDSGVTAQLTNSKSPNTLKIKAKNIPVAISWDMAAMIKRRFVGMYRCIIPRGISSPNATILANPRNTPTRATFCRRNAKKKTTEKWKIIHTNP